MTAQILATELANLVQDSKRKNTDLRNAADKSLQELKALPVTSEAQLAADPEIQLKILQALPSIVQNYAVEIRGDALAIVLQICSELQNSKNFAVSNTAAATLQQLVISVYDRVAAEDEKALEIPTSAEVVCGEERVSVRPAAHDAYKLFHDLNALVSGEKLSYLRHFSLPQTSSLELIEAILANHGLIVSSHAEQIHVIRSKTMPFTIRFLSDRHPFPLTLRIMRIFNVLLKEHMPLISSECEITLGLLNHMLDPEASPTWKRALCLEFFRGIYGDGRLVLSIYSHFDQVENKKDVLGDNLAAFVRLATEKPAIIGLGQTSSKPTFRNEGMDVASEQAIVEAGGLAGVISAPVSEPNALGEPIGISTQWSSPKIACMEQLDKVEPPSLSDTYVYSLVLTCITEISENLAKFVLPLTVHHENKGRRRQRPEDMPRGDSESPSSTNLTRRLSRSHSFRKKTVPVNPLELTSHPAYVEICTASSLVTECWPAVLASCSTFLNAALDDDYYRGLVRAIQKFTQVAGLLRLSTPRDAFLTTLGKAAVPPNMLLASMSSPKQASEPGGVFANAKGLLSVESLVSQPSTMFTDKSRRTSYESSLPALSARNLLCLRALINLAIALGPTLQSSWSIVFETLQVADMILALSLHQSGTRTPGLSGPRAGVDPIPERVETETAAVQAAARRLFESTMDFPNESFVELLQALCKLLNNSMPLTSGQETPTSPNRPQVLQQRRMGSVSNLSLGTDSASRDSIFILNKVGELVSLNESRLAHSDPSESGWTQFVSELVRFCANTHNSASARLLAADIISRTVKEIAQTSMTDEEHHKIQSRILSALQMQIRALYNEQQLNGRHHPISIQVHQIALEALKNVIEQCGDSLTAGWDAVFDSLLSIFSGAEDVEAEASGLPRCNVISKSLARSAFGSVQLVCSDFLAAVPEKSFSQLLRLLLNFCCQQDDFNMSLTSVTFFWNISDYLRSKSDLDSLPSVLATAQESSSVRRIVEDHMRDGSTPALWLQVLLDLSAVTTDNRAELRNPAIQTIQRIFENHSEQLSASTWRVCLRSVPFAMVRSNLAIHDSLWTDSAHPESDMALWNETTRTLLSSVALLIVNYLSSAQRHTDVGDLWSELLDLVQGYLGFRSHTLACSVFDTITTFLSQVEDSGQLGSAPLEKTAMVWRAYVAQFKDGDRQDWSGDNQEAFLAYTQAFKTLYHLSGRTLDAEMPTMLSNLQTCITESDYIPYSSDVDHTTPLQSLVLDCLSTLDSTDVTVREALIGMLSALTTLPYRAASIINDRGPTFVALSKSTMDILGPITVTHIKEKGVYPSTAFETAMGSLEMPIKKKYMWQREGKAPTLWQKATITALAILSTGFEATSCAKENQGPAQKLWAETLFRITHAIIGVREDVYDTMPCVVAEEDFDLKALSSVRPLVTEALGWSAVSDGIRRAYALNLFRASIIHLPTRGEVDFDELEHAPLDGLYRIRLGQTKNPMPIPRTEVAYHCLSELFSLVSASESPDRVRLGRATAPYLILRAALPLRAYIADHPLRGRMPAPETQRRELLFTLTALKELKSEGRAIPDTPGATSAHRKHLHRLYLLLVKASKVARNDAEVFEALSALLDMVGEEFGLEVE
ncbi:hypothetical protein M011DRAFT_401549 [Sporormia fimetaria CBS 119925]|uniref:Endosomal peripheral membrane protein-like protein n=1 Tax=Sporormia fimetaria CBS 119925 TaxID=1340428 RepID=A0A6A6VF13_9PLEO|nr:hypothetical protein M011DRAFT_401549 [Sporormia fimetaria CBS 119925]